MHCTDLVILIFLEKYYLLLFFYISKHNPHLYSHIVENLIFISILLTNFLTHFFVTFSLVFQLNFNELTTIIYSQFHNMKRI